MKCDYISIKNCSSIATPLEFTPCMTRVYCREKHKILTRKHEVRLISIKIDCNRLHTPRIYPCILGVSLCEKR